MKTIQVETTIHADIAQVWKFWSEPEHITQWAFASDEWECPRAENDLREGGKFLTRMSAKDQSAAFDFVGTYTTVVPLEKIEYTIEDGRKVSIVFEKIDENTTKVIEDFEMENENPEEMQKAGWQAILENFKKHAEGN